MNSAIYTGEVFHRRQAVRDHDFRYRVFYLLLDLDELDAVSRVSRLLSATRAAWFRFDERDHGAGGRQPLRDWCTDRLRDADLDGDGWRFRILTMPRMAGYVFNPISIIFCHRGDDAPSAIIYEVNNTFGERLAYVVPVNPDQSTHRHRCEKAMFVSPFFDMRGYYDFRLVHGEEHLRLDIDYRDDEQRRLLATFAGQRSPLRPALLWRLAATASLTALKVVAGIHYEALKIWLGGVPLHGHMRAKKTTSVGESL